LLICPDCAATTEADAGATSAKCSHCGRALSAADQKEFDNPLLDDLREAFELDADSFAVPGPCRLKVHEGSSAAYSRMLSSEGLSAGIRLGDFEIVEELGRGGMGVVYRARQLSLDREVALKVLPGYARFGEQAVQRFQTEARAAARLHHTNIVPVFAQGEHDGHCYYAMELVAGVGLDQVIRRDAGGGGDRVEVENKREQEFRRDADDYRNLAALAAQAADALECAHRQGVIHRDVKPHNLILGKRNQLHLMDFGLARIDQEPHLTLNGEIMGTPAYLSPEQLRGDPQGIDHRTDIYSLGVTLYEMITRCKPFDGETREQIITGICANQPASPRKIDRGIPADLETICLHAMEREPAARYATAAALAEDLRRFAEGRPILTRRVTTVRKVVRWARRRPTIVTTCLVSAAALVLAVGLTMNVTSSRHKQAARLLDDAYEQLAFYDYRAPNAVRDDIERAIELGADGENLNLVQALADLGASNETDAIRRLTEVLEADPTNTRALRLLAWAHYRIRQNDEARAAFDEAEQRGEPNSADEWFFRGLAIHYDDAAAAIESYRQAIAWRARRRSFYPQAVLHLARAHNQQLYANRSLDGFADADAALRQLIEHEQYGAYPYYLLSITHRLAAEIYSGSQGTRDDALVGDHYAEALDWARSGQEIDPSNERPITAEAECLESMGRYAEAAEIRDLAIETATNERARCEGRHYRWRLHYWLGDLEAAREDARRHAECMPDSRFYAHVYPALILAEAGLMEEALGHAYALDREAPESASAVLWSAACLRLLGRGNEAQSLLEGRRDTVNFDSELEPPQTSAWLRRLYAFSLGEGSRADLDALASEFDAPWKLWGEAAFHAGTLRLARGDREAAREEFRGAYRSFGGELGYSYHGKLLFIKMQVVPSWPSWITAPANVDAEAAPAAPRFPGEGGAE